MVLAYNPNTYQVILFFILLDILLVLLTLIYKLKKIPYFKRILIFLWIKKNTTGLTHQMNEIYTTLKKRLKW